MAACNVHFAAQQPAYIVSLRSLFVAATVSENPAPTRSMSTPFADAMELACGAAPSVHLIARGLQQYDLLLLCVALTKLSVMADDVAGVALRATATLFATADDTQSSAPLKSTMPVASGGVPLPSTHTHGLPSHSAHGCTIGTDESATHLKPAKTHLFFEFSPCLSRACLGKMIVFSTKWRKICVLRTDGRAALVAIREEKSLLVRVDRKRIWKVPHRSCRMIPAPTLEHLQNTPHHTSSFKFNEKTLC
jgi:hypothetical protein